MTTTAIFGDFSGYFRAALCLVRARVLWKKWGPYQWCIVYARNEAPKVPSSEGARIKASRGVGFLGRVCPLPNRLGDLGERRELPQRGPGRSPGRQRILGIFQGLISLLVEKKQSRFLGFLNDFLHFPKMRAPRNCGPGAAAPLAPPLMRP